MNLINLARDVYSRLVHIEDKENLIIEKLKRGGKKLICELIPNMGRMF